MVPRLSTLLGPMALALGLVLAGCASAPKPVHLDGADRVPVNDPATVEKLKRMAAEEGRQP